MSHSVKQHLLLIDDDEDMINLFSLHLKKDFHVSSELIGSNAIQAAAKANPKAVLLDLHMPNVDGFEVLMQFRNHPATANLPVICTSADTNDLTRDRAYQLGAIGFIKKPPNFNQLAKDIQGFLNGINPKLESFDKKRKYVIGFNEQEKASLLKTEISTQVANRQKVLLLAWQEGHDFLQEAEQKELIENESLVYLKIKPSLITKFPFMQELSSIINDIKSFINVDSKEFSLLIDEPSLLFGQQDSNNATAKIFALNEVLSKAFASTTCFSSKQRDPQKDAFLMGLAKAFVN